MKVRGNIMRPKKNFLIIAATLLPALVVGFYLGRSSSAPETASAQEEQDPHAGPQMSMEPAGKQTVQNGEREVLYWYDQMHPNYKSDKPGIAPDCGMDLVPFYADEAEALSKLPPGSVMLSSEKQQLIGVRTATVEHSWVHKTIRTVAHLAPDETRIAHVHTKFEGWIEKVYVDYVGKRVKKGQPLFTIYSPELVSTQEEYLLALKGQKVLGESPFTRAAKGSTTLLEAARRRLELWDISEEQIRELEQTGKVRRTLTIHSPMQGFVTVRNAYENAYVTPGTKIYSIVDLGRVWAMAMIYEYELPFIRTGQRATMSLAYQPGKKYRGRVTYIYPEIEAKSRTVKVRLEFQNPRLELKLDMYADVEIHVNYGRRLVVPSEAVLDSGMRKIVFLARPNGYFEPREIEVGPRLDNQFIVLKGLKAGDKIVTSGNFLIDSESRMSNTSGEVSRAR